MGMMQYKRWGDVYLNEKIDDKGCVRNLTD